MVRKQSTPESIEESLRILDEVSRVAHRVRREAAEAASIQRTIDDLYTLRLMIELDECSRLAKRVEAEDRAKRRK